MIRVFDKSGKVAIVDLDALPGHLPTAAWVDILKPDDADHAALKAALGIELPSHADISEIQISSQLFADDDILYMTTPVLAGSKDLQLEIGALALIVTPSMLITLRYVEPKSIDWFAERAQKNPAHILDTPFHTLLGLLETMIDRSVDILENIGDLLDTISSRLFAKDRQAPEVKKDPSYDLRVLLTNVGRAKDLLGNFRNVLSGVERVSIFMRANTICNADPRNCERLDTLQRDINVLQLHNDVLQERTTFMLDAVLGAVSIEQNNLFKILSVLSVIFMPPTLIAGIYGMNFQHMPELKWHLGYPLALTFILLSAILPLLYFRKKGWL